MSRKSSRSRSIRPGHAHRARRLTGFENLEGRQMMTTLFLDFGQDFSLAASGEHIFEAAGLDGLAVNAPTDSSVPDQLNSVLDALQERGIDYNANGGVDTSDVATLAQDVLQLVRRYYEPFNITVEIASSANLSEIVNLVTGRAGNDAYILIGGQQSNNGIANVDPGNTEDNIAFAFAETLVDRVGSDRSLLAMALAHTAAHEAAHTFGLRHLDESPTADESMLAAGDTMDVADALRHRKLKVFSRFDLAKDGGGTQNDFQVLKDTLGLRTNGPAFVTGTGAHDKIEINGIGNNQAQVLVKAFRNNGFAAADLIAQTSYTIDVSRGVLVEAGFGDDHVRITSVPTTVTLRGGQGNDTLLGGSAGDRLQGDHGNDLLSGLAGNDRYIFAGPRWWDLDDDTINDVSGAADTLDFSGFRNHVELDLASTAMQTIDPFIPVISPVNGFATLVGFPTFHNPHLRLQLLSGPFTTSTGIENVIGSQQSDVIRGNELANSLSGLGGNDQLEGRAGNDALTGGAGNDRYLFNGSLLGTDTINEGIFGGFDTLDFTGFDHAINVNLGTTAEQNLGGGNLRLRQSTAMLENVTGTRFNDVIRGNTLANFLQGGEGADVIYGGAGNDVIKGGIGNDYLYGEAGLDEIYGDADNDFLEGGYDGLLDLLVGGQGADTFVRYHTFVNTIYYRSDLVFQPIAEADKLGDFNSAEDVIYRRFV